MNISAQEQIFEKHVFDTGKYSLPYRFALPENYSENDTAQYPLILFLHGAGERGSDNQLQLSYIDIIFGSDFFRKNYPSFILAPQCPKENRWVEVDWSLQNHQIPEKMSIPLKMTMRVLINKIFEYNIDTNRIYITGLSMGGYGTWDLIARFPEIFAAAIPICGGGDENTAKKIADIPIWAFHGAKDNVVPVARTRNMISEIKQNAGKPKYTEFPQKGHLVWNAAYNTAGIWDWLFSQKKSE